MTITTLDHNTVVAGIDNLVTDILNPKPKISVKQVSEQLNLYYQPMALLYDNELEYTSSIKWFIGSCYLVCGNYYPNEIFWDEGMTKRFLRALTSYQYEYKTAITDFAFQEQRNSHSLFNYMSFFLSEFARVLIVRVDLKIKSEFAHQVDVEDFHGFMNELRDKIGKKRGCFADLRGNAWAIEQGVENGGLHCHLLLIYNGDKHWKDWYLGDAVGKQWSKITDGFGWCHNCNTSESKREYDRWGTRGVGMMHKNIPLEVINATNAALYLTRTDKYEQRLKAWLPNMRSFGHGKYP